MIGFTGFGEPFLIPNIVEAVKEITHKHYVIFNTNLTSSKIKEFAETIDPKKVVSICASLHIKELERRNLMDRFIDNFLYCRRKGFNIFVRVVAYPPLSCEIKKYTLFFKRFDIKLKFDPFIGVYDGKRYPDSYSSKELSAFGFKHTEIDEFHTKGRVCNAGYNTGIVGSDENIYTCSQIHENIGNIYKKISFKKKLLKCPIDSCDCPWFKYSVFLFEKALREKKGCKNNKYVCC